MPTMCDGNSCVNGKKNPVTLVKIVVARNSAVMPLILLEPRSPNMTMKPDATATRLIMTCTSVKGDRLIPKTIMRSPVSEPVECYDGPRAIAKGFAANFLCRGTVQTY